MSATISKTRDGSRCNQVLELRHEGKSFREIATIMGVLEGTARNMASKAIRGVSERAKGDAFNAWHQGEPHCPRCGLRGSHECLPTSATAYVGRRGEQDCGTDTGRRR